MISKLVGFDGLEFIEALVAWNYGFVCDLGKVKLFVKYRCYEFRTERKGKTVRYHVHDSEMDWLLDLGVAYLFWWQIVPCEYVHVFVNKSLFFGCVLILV